MINQKVNEKSQLHSSAHLFHLVSRSPWPFVCSNCLLGLTTSFTLYLHQYQGAFFLFIQAFILVILGAAFWWRDVIRESTAEGSHTDQVQEGLKEGMLLFIVSEIMFFFGFFWAFFNTLINPGLTSTFGTWPPIGIKALNPWDVPLLNTLILLTSGATVTWCHHALLRKSAGPALTSLLYTIILAIIFTGFQVFEYLNAPFTISDTVFGSTFFMATGFHGFHVFIGTLFLFVCFIRIILSHFTKTHHFGFEAAAWYWHFVDVVWLFLFVTVYWMGSLGSGIKPLDNELADTYLNTVSDDSFNFNSDTVKIASLDQLNSYIDILLSK